MRLAFGLRAPVIITIDEVDDDAIDDAVRRYAVVGTRLLIWI